MKAISMAVVGGFFVCVACGPSAATTPAAAAPESSSGKMPASAPATASAAPDSTCALLARACHGHDKEGATQHACHMLGHHSKDAAECEAKRAECLAACGSAAP